MALLNADVQQQVRQALEPMTGPVRVVMFTQKEGGALECAYCSDTRQLAEEIAALSDKITLEVRDFQKDADVAVQYGIDKIPAIAVIAGGDQPRDYGVRLYGIPSGYEFATFIEDLKMVSRGDAGLSPETMTALGRLTDPVHIQVYVTPT